LPVEPSLACDRLTGFSHPFYLHVPAELAKEKGYYGFRMVLSTFRLLLL
jgi:hypothetical protein